MNLGTVKRALIRDLRHETTVHTFNELRARIPVLSNYATPLSVNAALEDAALYRWREKEALLRAIISEQQQRPHQLWGALLITAFYPALSGIHCRIVSEHVDKAELVQIIVASFLDVVSEFPLDEIDSRTCMYLRQMTKRRVFSLLNLLDIEQETVTATDFVRLKLLEAELAERLVGNDSPYSHYSLWPGPRPSKRKWFSQAEQTCLIRFLKDKAKNNIEDDRLALVIATKIRGQRLSDMSRNVHFDLSRAAGQRAYQKLKRRHSRALERIREIFAPSLVPEFHKSPLPLWEQSNGGAR